MPKYRVIFDTGEEKTLESVRQKLDGPFVSFFGEYEGEPALVASYPSDCIVAIELEAAVDTEIPFAPHKHPEGAKATHEILVERLRSVSKQGPLAISLTNSLGTRDLEHGHFEARSGTSALPRSPRTEDRRCRRS